MGSKKIIRYRNKILVTLLIFFLISLDFLLLTMSKKFVKEEKAINKQSLIFSLINSQLIALFNSLMSRIIRSFENKSFYTTQSSYYYETTFKLVVLFMFNMLITTFFSNVASFYFIHADSSTFDIFPLNFESYLFDVFFLLITNPFVSYFLIVFDHRQGYKYYKRRQLENGKTLIQAEANLYY